MPQVTEENLAAFLAKLQAKIDAFDDRPNNQARRVLSVQRGAKYGRIVVTRYDDDSAYGFIDLANGDLLKADGWKRPAKGVRGNMFAADPLAGCSQYGMVYFR
jgi:hypothetical protein